MPTKAEIRLALILSATIVATGILMNMMKDYSFIQKATAGYGA
ncbi:MAG: hypothetical protein Q7V31_16050 [Parvibaculum sp.]|nr:hypothetical protein [Parvibaculum sp.]MDO8840426.1 hypothetical protein [Parvibaculum sp.]